MNSTHHASLFWRWHTNPTLFSVYIILLWVDYSTVGWKTLYTGASAQTNIILFGHMDTANDTSNRNVSLTCLGFMETRFVWSVSDNHFRVYADNNATLSAWNETQPGFLAAFLSLNLLHSQRPPHLALSCFDPCSMLFLSCQVQVLFLVISFMSQCELIRADSAVKRRSVEVGLLRLCRLMYAS